MRKFAIIGHLVVFGSISHAAAQDPGIDFTTALPTSAPVSEKKNEKHILLTSSSQDRALISKKVSVDFENASSSDLMGWFKEQKVNFVVSATDFPCRGISLFVENEPLEDVIQALGVVLQGHFILSGNIIVFKKADYTAHGTNETASAMAKIRVIFTTLEREQTSVKAKAPASPPVVSQVNPKKLNGQSLNRVLSETDAKRQVLAKLVKSLTELQCQMIKAQGFISGADLKSDQVKLLKLALKGKQTEVGASLGKDVFRFIL